MMMGMLPPYILAIWRASSQDRIGSAGLVQSCGSGMQSSTSLAVLGMMLMVEPGMEKAAVSGEHPFPSQCPP